MLSQQCTYNNQVIKLHLNIYLVFSYYFLRFYSYISRVIVKKLFLLNVYHYRVSMSLSVY